MDPNASHSDEAAAPKFQPVTAETTDTENTATPASSPGARLRAAREARNMAVSNVGSLLRLDNAVIEALEADDFANLPSATFVKGYLRSYGRLVNLDGELLVAEYDQIAAPPPAAEDDLKVTPLGSDSGNGAMRWIVLLLALLLIVGIAWYWSKPSEQPVSTETLRSEPNPPAAELETTNLALVAANGAASEDDGQTTDEVIDALLREPTEPEPTAAVEAAPPAIAEETPEQAAESADTEAAVAAEEEDVTLVTLTLLSVEESWVSISDATDQRLYRDLLKPGVTQTLKGQPPFSVLFGNAPAVLLEINGTSFNHQAWHKANGTARFVLNPSP